MEVGQTTGRPILIYLPFIWIILTNHYNVIAGALTTIKPLSLNAFTGDSVTFDCSTDHKEKKLSWQWFKVKDKTVQNIALENKFTLDEYELLVNDRISKITQLNVSMEDDQSQYYCQYGSVSEMATLTVISQVGLESRYPQCEVNVSSANTEKSVTFMCSTSGGNSEPILQWYNADNRIQQKEFACYNNKSYCVQFQYILSVEDEGKVFNCKTEGTVVRGTKGCSAKLIIPPTVIVSTKSTAFYDGDSLELICAAETPWRVVDYQWHANDQPVASTDLQYHLEDNGRVILISNLNTNHAGIEIRCNVSTASGLVGSDVFYFGDINTKCGISIVILVICFSCAVVCAFILGICITKFSKRKKHTQEINYSIKKDNLKQMNEDSSHEYETILIDKNPSTVNTNRPITTGYSVPTKTKLSKYQEINPSPINLDHSEYMCSEA